MKRFPQAAAGYGEAIAALSAIAPKSESLLNLQMNLAEVRRQQGLYTEATSLLDSVEASINRTPPLDPFLPARLWRGRSRLQESQKMYESAAKSEMKAFEIALLHFAPASVHTVDAYNRLVHRLCELNAFNSVLEVMARADVAYESMPKQHAKVTAAFQATFAKFCKWAIEDKRVEVAGIRLSGLCKVYKDLAVLVQSCRHWFSTSKLANAIFPYDDLAANLQTLLEREKPSAENILVLIDGQCLVVDLYRRAQHKATVPDQLRITGNLLLEAKKLGVAEKKLEPLQKAILRLQTDLNKAPGKEGKLP